jgi:hypothetical protein
MLVAEDYSLCLSVFLHLSILLRLYNCNVLLRALVGRSGMVLLLRKMLRPALGKAGSADVE